MTATYAITNVYALQLVGIEYGVDGSALIHTCIAGQPPKASRHKIHYNARGEAYITVHGIRHYLRNFIRDDM